MISWARYTTRSFFCCSALLALSARSASVRFTSASLCSTLSSSGDREIAALSSISLSIPVTTSSKYRLYVSNSIWNSKKTNMIMTNVRINCILTVTILKYIKSASFSLIERPRAIHPTMASAKCPRVSIRRPKTAATAPTVIHNPRINVIRPSFEWLYFVFLYLPNFISNPPYRFYISGIFPGILHLLTEMADVYGNRIVTLGIIFFLPDFME